MQLQYHSLCIRENDKGPEAPDSAVKSLNWLGCGGPSLPHAVQISRGWVDLASSRAAVAGLRGERPAEPSWLGEVYLCVWGWGGGGVGGRWGRRLPLAKTLGPALSLVRIAASQPAFHFGTPLFRTGR
jgi:hypothetical protein